MMNKMVKKILAAGIMAGLLAGGTAYAQKPVYDSADGMKVGSRLTFDYLDDSMFHVNTQVGYVTDIELKQGETVTYIAGGDTTRWLIDKAMVGNVQHIYIKPTAKDITTNVIINTNLHSYRLEVSSGDSYDPLVTFNFHDRPKVTSALSNPTGRTLDSIRAGRRVDGKNYDYRIKAKTNADVSLMPAEIFDDGTKTYIKIKDTNKYDLPVIYSIDPWDPKKLSMVNYRRQGDYFVVDRVMEHGRLFYHQKFYIDFYNEGIVKTETKEYRQRDTMASRVRGAYSDGGTGKGLAGDSIAFRDRQAEQQARYEREQQENLAQARKNLAAREREQQRLQKEREAQIEAQRIAQEKARAAQIKEQQRLQKEREAQIEAQRVAQEKARAAQIKEQQRLQAEQQAKLEAQRLAQQKAQEAALKERQRQEKERQALIAKQQAEQEKARIAAQKERERQERERQAAIERQRIAQQKEQERIEKERQALLRQKEAEAKRLAEQQAAAQENLRKMQEAEKLAVAKRQQAEQAVIAAQRQRQADEQQYRQLLAQQQQRQQVQQQQAVNTKAQQAAYARERDRQEQLRFQEAKRIEAEQKARAAYAKQQAQQQKAARQVAN